MLSGPDQDGHMKMALELSKALLENGEIKSEPSALYVPMIPSFEERKESASGPGATIYLGPLRNTYIIYPDGQKRLVNIEKLSLNERIDNAMTIIDSYSHGEHFKDSLKKRGELLDIFSDVDLISENYVEKFKEKVKDIITNHYNRRSEILSYAAGKELQNMNDDMSRQVFLELLKDKKIQPSLKLSSFWHDNNYKYDSYCKQNSLKPWYSLVLEAISNIEA